MKKIFSRLFILLLFVLAGSAVPFEDVKADTFTVNAIWSTATVNLSNNTFSPGQIITTTGSITVSDALNPAYADLTANIVGQGGAQTLVSGNLGRGTPTGFGSAQFIAPLAPGAYNLVFTANTGWAALYGLNCWWCPGRDTASYQMPFTVVAPTPINGTCGSDGALWDACRTGHYCPYRATTPTNLCSSGSPSQVTPAALPAEYTGELVAGWVWNCNGSNGGSAMSCAAYETGPPPPPQSAPSLNFSVSPSSITTGNSSTLTWTVGGEADSCWASGGWSGWKSFSGTASEAVNPTVTTTYNLECWKAGVSSGQRSATVNVSSAPASANLTPNNCTIPAGNNSCNIAVSWTSANTVGPVSVRQDGTQFSTNPSLPGGTSRTINHGPNTFSFFDNGGQITSAPATASCVSTATWNAGTGVCDALPLPPTPPTITITADPKIVRTNQTAPINISITANYAMNCTLYGVNLTPILFDHIANIDPQSYNFTTRSLKSTTVAQVTCTDGATITETREARVEVLGTVEEV